MGSPDLSADGAPVRQSMLDSIKDQLRKQLGQEPPQELLHHVLVKVLEVASVNTAKRRESTLDQVHSYWRGASDEANRPEAYIDADPKRGELLLRLLGTCRLDDPSILEIGCNVGRNLECLRQAGYRRIAGIEINQSAVDLLKQHYPQLAETASITVSSVEDAITALADASVDVVFSMAVFVHLHTDSDWVFGEIARVARKHIITIEDETCETERHFKRNYKDIFEALGFRQLSVQNCKGIPGLASSYTARAFKAGDK